jgi:hypothetical protein
MDHAELPINTNRECSALGKGRVADSVQMVFQVCGVDPCGDRRQANHDIRCHQPASNFCQLSIPLVLTISETYDHILQYGVR